jgi:hypothetical protein
MLFAPYSSSVNNAGIGAFGTFEFVDEAVARATFETKSMRPSASSTLFTATCTDASSVTSGGIVWMFESASRASTRPAEASGFLAVA